jgi:hypothetical protein
MLTNRIVTIKDLSPGDINIMYRLMNTYYDNIKRETFEKDLNAKKGALLVFDQEESLCGFTTYDLFHIRYENDVLHMLYSGDTVIREEYWGHIETSRMFMLLVEKCLRECPGPLYWFLITKGIRTYRLLPLYFRAYFPTYQSDTPPFERELIAYLAEYKFGDHYKKDQGVIRFEDGGDCLKNEYANIAQNKLKNPHIRFFCDANPGYIAGDYLPCLAQIHLDNLTHKALRFIGQTVTEPEK